MLDAFAWDGEARFESLLRALHRSPVASARTERENEHDGEQRVEIVGDRGDEGVEAVFAQVSANCHCPR